MMGLANKTILTAEDGEFPHEEIPVTEMEPLVKEDPKVTCMDVGPCPETKVVFEGSVHWYDEQPEIGRMEYVAVVAVPRRLQTDVTDWVNTGTVAIASSFG